MNNLPAMWQDTVSLKSKLEIVQILTHTRWFKTCFLCFYRNGWIIFIEECIKLQDESSLQNLKLFAELEVIFKMMIEARIDVSPVCGACGTHRTALRGRRRWRIVESWAILFRNRRRRFISTRQQCEFLMRVANSLQLLQNLAFWVFSRVKKPGNRSFESLQLGQFMVSIGQRTLDPR